MQRRFDGKTFMVTGAGTGFGAALSRRAAQAGAAKVIVHYRRSPGGAEGTAETVCEAGAEAMVVRGDITSWTEVTEEAVDHVLALDIKGTMLMVHEFGQRMVQRGGGAIVSVGSGAAEPEWQAGRREVVLSGTPAGKIPKPEEMTGAALFLASEDAHDIPGSYMIADGG
ncbi:MAG TPA: SDR family NAD(P)-dependent oxidoreductase [Solirubrobacteraceae bacterium]|nr:SDR family NAD(P)-dependent oxidoreductase [Solirubrobacteraceae bacterium]